MKQSDLRKLYLSCINLYGFVLSDNLFEILDHYGIPYKKEQILKDLQDRSTKNTRDYSVQEISPSNYIIVDLCYSPEEFEKLYYMKEDKPRYYPKTYEYLLEYSNFDFKDEKDQEGFKNLFQFLRRHLDDDDNVISFIADFIICSIKKEIDNKINIISGLLELLHIEFPNQKVLEKFLGVMQNVSNDLRTPCNNGFTPNEMRKKLGPIDMNEVSLTIVPNMRKDFLNGKLNPYTFLNDLDNYDLPPKAKESFKTELLEIIDEMEKSH